MCGPDAAARRIPCMTPKATKSKPVPKTGAHKQPDSVGVGDEVRLPAELPNQFTHYDARQEFLGRTGDAIEGLVCSIREIATGKQVAKTHGALEHYVLEIVHNRTFSPQYGSRQNIRDRNGRPAVDLATNEIRTRVADSLRQAASQGEYAGRASDLLQKDPFAALLDGWRVVKLRASLVELL
jgi:hypothetical protein